MVASEVGTLFKACNAQADDLAILEVTPNVLDWVAVCGTGRQVVEDGVVAFRLDTPSYQADVVGLGSVQGKLEFAFDLPYQRLPLPSAMTSSSRRMARFHHPQDQIRSSDSA